MKDHHPLVKIFVYLLGVALLEGKWNHTVREYRYSRLKDSPRFDFDNESFLNSYAAKGSRGKLIVQCYKMFRIEGFNHTRIGHDMKIDPSTVSKYVSIIEGLLDEVRGKRFEGFFAREIAPIRYQKYERRGGQGEPDGIGYYANGSIEVVALKCRDIPRNSATVKADEVIAEQREARRLLGEHKTVKCILYLYEMSRHITVETEIDPNVERLVTVPMP